MCDTLEPCIYLFIYLLNIVLGFEDVSCKTSLSFSFTKKISPSFSTTAIPSKPSLLASISPFTSFESCRSILANFPRTRKWWKLTSFNAFYNLFTSSTLENLTNDILLHAHCVFKQQTHPQASHILQNPSSNKSAEFVPKSLLNRK